MWITPQWKNNHCSQGAYILMGEKKTRVKLLKYTVYKMSINKWMDEQIWYIHTIEYYLVIKRNEVRHTATWMTLKNIMVSQRSQTQNRTAWFYSYETPGKSNSCREQISDCWGLTSWKHKGPFLGIRNVLYLHCGGSGGYTCVYIHTRVKTHRINCTLKNVYVICKLYHERGF